MPKLPRLAAREIAAVLERKGIVVRLGSMQLKRCGASRFSPSCVARRSIRLQTPGGELYPLVEHLQALKGAGRAAQWAVRIPLPGPQPPLTVRLCAVRKSAAAIAQAQKKLRRKARKQGWQVQPESLIYAQYVMVLSTFPAAQYSTRRGLGSLPTALAGGTGVQASETDRAVGAFAQT